MSVLIPHCINSLSLSLSFSLSLSSLPLCSEMSQGKPYIRFRSHLWPRVGLYAGTLPLLPGTSPMEGEHHCTFIHHAPPPSNYIAQILIWKNPLFYFLWLTAFPILNSSPDVFPLAPAQAFQLNFSFWTSYYYHFLANL